MKIDTIFIPADQVPQSGIATPLIAVKFLESGFYPVYTRSTAECLNGSDVTPEIMESAIIGSMFGWDVPGAKEARHYFLGKETE